MNNIAVSPSFAELAKEESARAPRNNSEKRAFLSAFIRMNGYLRLRGNNNALEVSSENSSIAKVVYEYLRDLYDVKARFAYTRNAGFLKRIVYHVILEEGVEEILKDLEIDFFLPTSPSKNVQKSEDMASFFAGAFLAGGSVNNPHSSSYHLEIACKEEAFAKFLLKLICKYPPHPFSAKMVTRRSKSVIYIKRGDEISDFLILLGAKENCLLFEDVRISRDFALIGNRLANLDTANYQKSQKAGLRQVEEINYLIEKRGWSSFDNEKIKALFKIRLEHPDASLNELAALLSDELNTTISRSNVNHLLRYLDKEYERALGYEKKRN